MNSVLTSLEKRFNRIRSTSAGLKFAYIYIIKHYVKDMTLGVGLPTLAKDFAVSQHKLNNKNK